MIVCDCCGQKCVANFVVIRVPHYKTYHNGDKTSSFELGLKDYHVCDKCLKDKTKPIDLTKVNP